MAEEMMNWRVFLTGMWVVVAIIVLSIAVCSYRDAERLTLTRAAELEAVTARIAACVQNGGEWLRVPNAGDFECRRQPA